MFDDILRYVKINEILLDVNFDEIVKFTTQLINKTEKLESVLRRAKIKYQFEKLKSIELNKGEVEGGNFNFNRVGFWMNEDKFNLSLGVEGDIDEEFNFIFHDADFSISSFRDTSNNGIEEVMNIAHKLFYTWIAYYWQKNRLYECGIPMYIETYIYPNTYYLNDFMKSHYSEYNDIYPRKKIKGRFYSRDLSLEEIFICTYYFRDSVKEIKLKGEKKNQFIEIIMEGTKCSLFKGEIGTKGNLIEEKEFDFLHKYKSKHESSIYYIANQFKIAVNSNWKFKLSKN